MQKWVRSLGWEDLLEKEMATHSSTDREISRTEEPGRLHSSLQKSRMWLSDWTTNSITSDTFLVDYFSCYYSVNKQYHAPLFLTKKDDYSMPTSLECFETL